jgi:hypothetical protein
MNRTCRENYAIASYLLQMWRPRAIESRLQRSAKTRPLGRAASIMQESLLATLGRDFDKVRIQIRSSYVKLPFSLAFHIHPRREHELFTAPGDRSSTWHDRSRVFACGRMQLRGRQTRKCGYSEIVGVASFHSRPSRVLRAIAWLQHPQPTVSFTA